MAHEALGRLFDISTGFTAVDMSSAANTGKRVSLRHAGGVSIVFAKAAGTAGQDPVLTLNEHTASTGGTSQVLAALTKYYYKQATTLAGSETWTAVTQTAASTITFNATSAESEAIYVIELEASQLSDGFDYISVDVADVGANAQLGTVLYFLRDLHAMRKPANLAAGLS
jgi:SpoU rRNA methylase family enzyme